jgi:hypothetical protein
MKSVNEEGKGGRILLMYFLYMYEHGIVKLVEVIFKKGVEED